MSGTTLCPHCDTRFRIAEPQLKSHQGMVRCGHCLQAFDARPGYIPDQPNPQLELPIPDEPRAAGTTLVIEEVVPVEETASADAPAEKTGLIEAIPPAGEAATAETPPSETLSFSQPNAPVAEPESKAPPVLPHQADVPVAALTLAEQVVIVQDKKEDNRPPPPAYRRWPWAVAAALLLLALFAQAAYFFRIDLAAHLPGLKPALTGYCKLLGCSVPLPQETGLMSIESSDLEASPEHENQITLNALLRNRASYPQAFPSLELTLNDTQDKPLARRIFKPKDYLPPQESEQTGLLPNHELTVKLYLNTADLRPTGYRLVLYYPRQ